MMKTTTHLNKLIVTGFLAGILAGCQVETPGTGIDSPMSGSSPSEEEQQRPDEVSSGGEQETDGRVPEEEQDSRDEVPGGDGGDTGGSPEVPREPAPEEDVPGGHDEAPEEGMPGESDDEESTPAPEEQHPDGEMPSDETPADRESPSTEEDAVEEEDNLPTADPTEPPKRGDLTVYSTLNSIGVEWRFGGDGDRDAECRIWYREKGAAEWQEGWPLYRIDYRPPNPVKGQRDPFEGCAGSVFFLEPNTEYELKLSLRDPDGIRDEGVVNVRTLAEPAIAPDAPIYYVAPGDGGGSGTRADPYRGIEEAQRHARPGDVFLLTPGEYTGFAGGEIRLEAAGEEGRWVVWKAAGDGVTFVDPVRIAASYVWLEGVHLQARPDVEKPMGLRTYFRTAPTRVVIRGNTFTGFFHAIYLNHGGSNWVITDNVIVGNKDLGVCLDANGEVIRSGTCPREAFGGEGIELNYTSGHTVAYNSISRVADGISYPLRNVDIFGNEIFDVTDDGIEGDFGYANIRVWQNRITNARNNGLSFQPMNGGPWYFIRNQVAAPRESTLKLRRLSRVLLAHNLLIGWNNVVSASYDTEGMRRIDSLNNLYISVAGRYVWVQVDNGPVEARQDYDGFDWGNATHPFKWDGRRFTDLASFKVATGVERRGFAFDRRACLKNMDAVAKRPPQQADALVSVTLRQGCSLVDAGTVLPGITAGYLGAAPDLGPYEQGRPVPHFGPRRR